MVVDHTGETKWPFGFEDVFGDGAKFTAAEQAIDIRTAYARTDATRFWIRTYFSSTTAVGADVTTFVFIDNDKNSTTGGSAAQKTINPAFATDPSKGGYEVVLTLNGDGTFGPLWTWNQGQGKFVSSNIMPNRGKASVGVDLDPLRIAADNHGYVQGSVDFSVVGLDGLCNAVLFIRSVDANGKTDRDGDKGFACVPDKDEGGIPVVIIPPSCKTNDDCPDFGVCVKGLCLLAPPCRVDTDCEDGKVCTDDGRCVPKPMGTCETTDDCKDGLVCKMGACVACAPESNDCGDGVVCLPTGVCDAGGAGGSGGGSIVIPPGGGVRGGACKCTAAGASGDADWALALFIPALAWFGRRSKKRSRLS